MSRASSLLLLAPLACTATSPDSRTLAATRDSHPITLSPGPAQKLRLELSLKHGPAVIDVGQHVEVAANIRNVSPDPVTVVLPGDGSAAALREPHISFTGTLDRGRGPTPLVPRVDRGRCGMFDSDWHDDIVTIPPGGDVPLEWLGVPSLALAMDTPGRIALTMHYRWTAGEGVPDFDPDDMAATPAFELTSNALQFERAAPLTLKLRPRDLDYDGKILLLSDYYELAAHNHTDAPRDLPVVIAAELRLPADPANNRPEEEYRYSREAPPRADRRVQPITVPPGASVAAPDLAAFAFPFKPSWAAEGVPGTFTLWLEGMSEPVPVDIDVILHGHAR